MRCRLCTRSFRYLGHLKQHEDAYSIRKSLIGSLGEALFGQQANGHYKCEFCSGFSAKRKEHYVRHLQKNHLRPHPNEAHHAFLWKVAMAKNDVKSRRKKVSERRANQTFVPKKVARQVCETSEPTTALAEGVYCYHFTNS